MLHRFLIASLVLLGLSACAGPADTKPYTLEGVIFNTDGAPTPGSNTMQAKTNIDLTKWAEQHQLDPNDIREVVITKVEITPKAGSFQDLESVLVQLVGEQSGLLEVAVANPVDKAATSLAPKISQQNVITPFVANGKPIAFLLDANATNGDSIPYQFAANFTFNITAGKKTK